MALKALKTDEELSAIPVDQPVLVELPTGMVDVETTNDNKVDPTQEDDAKKLEQDFAALRAEVERERERAKKAEQDRQAAIRDAEERAEENKRLRTERESDETALIKNGLAAAQSERDAAMAALKHAFEAGDADALAKAQSRISRSEAQILAYESGAAEAAERSERRKAEPERKPQQQAPDFAVSVQSNPNLLQAEKDWMIRNRAAFDDPDFRMKLDFAYNSAMKNGNVVRGSAEYFDHIEKQTGLKKVESTEEGTSVSAPVSRNDRDNSGRITNGKIMLTPEQREIARSLGVSDIEYAKQVVAYDQAKRSDPDRYR